MSAALWNARVLAVGLVGVVAACGGKSEGDSHADGGTITKAVSSSSANGDDAGAVVGGAARTKRGEAVSYEGEFTAEASTLSVPDGVKWKPDDAAKEQGLGKGNITLDVKDDGRVDGKVTGAFGEALVRGLLDEGVLRAIVVRKEPNDSGFSGTMLASSEGSALAGKLAVSLGNAGALREAKITLRRAGAVAPKAP